MSEPRDTQLDIAPLDEADWDKPTPRVVVPPPDDAYLRGYMTALNDVYAYLQLPTSFEVVEEDGTRHPMSAEVAARHLQAVRDKSGV